MNWLDFFVGFWWGLFWSIIVSIMIGPARADNLDVAATMVQVNAILETNVTESPRLEFVDSLPGHAWGWYQDGHIQISREAPEGCFSQIGGHEIAHWISVKAGLLRDVPNCLVKAEMEAISRRVEEAWEPWAPGCMHHD